MNQRETKTNLLYYKKQRSSKLFENSDLSGQMIDGGMGFNMTNYSGVRRSLQEYDKLSTQGQISLSGQAETLFPSKKKSVTSTI